MWQVVRAANRTGSLSFLPGISSLTVAGFDHIAWKSVGWNSDTPPAAAVYLGTPGRSRKAVMHLLDSASGVCQAVLKVPMNDAARSAILREADVLVSLATEGFAFAPRLLALDRDRAISSQTVIPGTHGSRRLLPEYLQLLRSLRLPGQVTSIVEHAATLQEQLLWSARSDHDLATLTASLSQLCDADPMPAFWVHGDFAPWNIKHRSDGLLALLDWEDARPGGLPLQDAFHFLHNQDYLFGRRPTSHRKTLVHFASDLGITTAQCRKLEIAYLAHSYLERLAQQQPNHSDFLLDSLRVVLQDGQRSEAPYPVRRNQLQPLPKPVSTPVALRMRSNLLSALITQFNRAQVPYCILSGFEEYPDRIPSDVDLMVHPADMPRVSALLVQAAERCGAQVLQAIQHETSACYFVLAQDAGRQVGFLNPDCCTDYRRRGRLWLRAAPILAARGTFKSFYVPSAPDEFIYYLIKKVLKQSTDAGQMRRLHDLHARAPHDCSNRLLRFWSAPTAAALEQSLVEQDLAWFASNSGHLLTELEASRPVECTLDRFFSAMRRAVALLKRALHPTGMCVIVSGGNEARVWNVANSLQATLEPCFRWTNALPLAEQFCPDSSNDAQRSGWARSLKCLRLLRIALNIRVARMRSTLAICTVHPYEFARGEGPRLSSWFVRLMLRPDLVLVLPSGHSGISTAEHDWLHSLLSLFNRWPVTYLNQSLPTEDIVYHASRAILQWLATRQARRLNPGKGPLTPSEAPFSQGYPEPADLPCVEAD
jgi:Phosphotransferase enzyme family